MAATRIQREDAYLSIQEMAISALNIAKDKATTVLNDIKIVTSMPKQGFKDIYAYEEFVEGIVEGWIDEYRSDYNKINFDYEMRLAHNYKAVEVTIIYYKDEEEEEVFINANDTDNEEQEESESPSSQV
jgi:hypothetical protein